VACKTTFAPDTGLLYASYAVTVIVLGVIPSAGTLTGLAVTSEVVGLTVCVKPGGGFVVPERRL
jgi:hypothetical protein